QSVRAAPTAVSASNADAVRASLDKWADFYGVDRSLARALAWMESGYNNEMVSSVGAQGVMQVMPTTWEYVENVLIGHEIADHGPDGNIHVGMAYLSHLLKVFDGDERLPPAGGEPGERPAKGHGPA